MTDQMQETLNPQPVQPSPGAGEDTEAPLLSVRDLKKHFPVRGGLLKRTISHVRAVDGISFDIRKGEIFGLVGESGCGKTTAGRTILRLTEATAGAVDFGNKNVFSMNNAELKRFRRQAQIIFQDPYGSLDPRMPVGDIVGEGLKIHGLASGQQLEERVREMMEVVGLRGQYARRYPHEFSGGQRQRIGIARALVLHPDFIVCDEPVSALDVSIQSQVLNLLRRLRQELQLTYLFIAHNLSVVKYISDRIAVMYLGKLVELAPAEELYTHTMHPYTVALVSSIPQPDPTYKPKRVLLQGDVPSPANPPPGCRFHTRCPQFRHGRCDVEEPEFAEKAPGHFVACHLY